MLFQLPAQKFQFLRPNITMPTRIVRKNASAPPAALAVMTTEPTYRGPSNFAKALVRQDSVISSGSSASDDDNREDITSSFHGSVRSSRKAAGYRSSILRDMSVRRVLRAADNDSDNDSITSANEQLIRLSANDIRASPRLLGYLFGMIASAVMLVSVVLFYLKEIASDAQPVDYGHQRYFITKMNSLVIRWKLIGALVVSAIGIGSSLLILLLHFDTVVAPKTWIYVFRDGSTVERNLILLLVLFWALAVHVCTSSSSVGESQPNVFFTAWVAFGAVAHNLSVWRDSAGKPPIFEQLSGRQHQQKRKTTYNWTWTAFFSTIFAGSMTELMFSRNNPEFRLGEETLFKHWILFLIWVWVDVVICIVAIVFNELLPRSSWWTSPCYVRRTTEDNYYCVFGWQQMEGPVVLILAGLKLYFILEYTGVNGFFNGLSNPYFSVWGTLFNSLFCFATWLREYKKINYIIRIPRDANATNTNSSGQIHERSSEPC